MSRVDALLGGRVQLEQPCRGLRVAIDSVLVAAAVPARPGDRVLDVGAGTGAVSLCLNARVPGLSIVAVERDPVHAMYLRRNLARNAAAASIAAVEADLQALPPDLRNQSFDIVVTNPPYVPSRQGTPSPEPGRKAAAMESVALELWLDLCLRRLRPRGWLVLIHRAARVGELLAALKSRCGGFRIFPLWPRADSPEARRLLLLARKGVREESHLLRGLVLHDQQGKFTPEAEAILRHARGIPGLADLRPPEPSRETCG